MSLYKHVWLYVFQHGVCWSARKRENKRTEFATLLIKFDCIQEDEKKNDDSKEVTPNAKAGQAEKDEKSVDKQDETSSKEDTLPDDKPDNVNSEPKSEDDKEDDTEPAKDDKEADNDTKSEDTSEKEDEEIDKDEENKKGVPLLDQPLEQSGPRERKKVQRFNDDQPSNAKEVLSSNKNFHNVYYFIFDTSETLLYKLRIWEYDLEFDTWHISFHVKFFW